ncbi:ABC transporter ATP-binding protein [Timonella sp. A28]|uniref:ABC transporter ATP-binding protein n=1 Tax=Timonella sp. A28 TaxID=3442640 RepID=UPI003EC0DE4F
MNGLNLNAISRSFGDHQVLHSTSLTVQRGEIVGFIGGNGAGKTTTMRIILGLLEPSAGDITWDGQPITAADRRSIGYMPEERGLYPQMPVRDQIIHFALLEGHTKPSAVAKANQLIASLGLQGREKTLIQDLSLGNQQRVQLAVSLVGEPALLVLDEPFSGLDPLAVESMAALLQEQADMGVGILFSSHQLELVERICDRVCILDKGKVMANGAVSELQNDGRSRWTFNFSTPATQFAAEVALIAHTTIEFIDESRQNLLLTVDGNDQDLPLEVLAAASRQGYLRSIETYRKSLGELLSQRFISAGIGTSTPSALVLTGDKS